MNSLDQIDRKQTLKWQILPLNSQIPSNPQNQDMIIELSQTCCRLLSTIILLDKQ